MALKKILVLVLSVFVLIGCGDGEGTGINITGSNETNQSFFINGSQWNIYLPGSWKILSTPSNRNKVFLAQKDDEGLSILGGKVTDDTDTSDMFKNLGDYFINFTETSRSARAIKFQAQNGNNGPLQAFSQKAVLSNDDTFLVLSCNYDLERPENDCDLILDSIARVEEEK